jgi:hypothetical protein
MGEKYKIDFARTYLNRIPKFFGWKNAGTANNRGEAKHISDLLAEKNLGKNPMITRMTPMNYGSVITYALFNDKGVAISDYFHVRTRLENF